MTIIWSILAVEILAMMDFFLCPQPDLYTNPFAALSELSCGDVLHFSEFRCHLGFAIRFKPLRKFSHEVSRTPNTQRHAFEKK